MDERNAVTRAEFEAAKEPTGPPSVSLWQLWTGPRADPLERWARIRREHGDVARYRYGFGDTYFVSHPDGVRRVLQDNAANYSKQHPAFGMLRKVLGNGLFTSDGSFWLRQRRLAQPSFHRQRISAMAAQVSAAAVELGDQWEGKPGGQVSMLHEMSALTLRIVGDALFGVGLAAQSARVSQAWGVLNTQWVERLNTRRLIPPVLPTVYDRAFRSARRALFEVVDELVAEKRASGTDSADLLSTLLHAKDADTGEQMTDGQLRDEVITLLLGGHETTAVALSWIWALLDQHPAVCASLQRELNAVLGGRVPTAEDFPRLTYSRAVVDEAMRLHPPAYVLFRRAKKDDVVCGHRIHRGGAVVIAPLALHRSPDFWERPDAFDPERWTQTGAARARFAFIPFGGGPRQCIGNNFALMEAVLVLATLAQRFSPRLADGYHLKPEYAVTLRPAGGLPMRLQAAGRS